MNVIYRRKSYNIYKVGNGRFIVHNTKKEFKLGHTHIYNFNAAKKIIAMDINKEMPDHLSKYLIQSIIRISTDKKYINKLKELLV